MALVRSSLLLAFVTNATALLLSARGPESGFTTYEEFRDYVSEFGVKFVDIGASKGGSRNMLEDMLHLNNTVKPGCPVVVGIDLNTDKLNQCNHGAPSQCPFCVQADLRNIVASQPGHGHLEAKYALLDGAQMKDILQHVNEPIDPEIASRVPASRIRKLGGQTFDTAFHEMAVALWRVSCLMSRKACSMEGPSFDNEEALRATGYIQYYAQWSGHTSHVNSTSMAAAIAGLPATRKTTSLLALSREIRSSTDSRILRLPPDVKDQACDDSNPLRFSLGCDRHQYGSKEEEAMDKGLREEGFEYPKDMGKVVDLSSLGIYEKMYTFVAFDVDPDRIGPPHMSPETASMLLKIPQHDLNVVSCKLHGRALVGKECAEQLFKLAHASVVNGAHY
jgi:hypothetical protein